MLNWVIFEVASSKVSLLVQSSNYGGWDVVARELAKLGKFSPPMYM